MKLYIISNALFKAAGSVLLLLLFCFCHKIPMAPSKPGVGREEERNKVINPLSHITAPGRKPPLPSFKVA